MLQGGKEASVPEATADGTFSSVLLLVQRMLDKSDAAHKRLLEQTAAASREQIERVCSGLRDELTTTARNEAKHAALISRDFNSEQLEEVYRVVARQSGAASAIHEAQHAPPAAPVPEQPVALDDSKHSSRRWPTAVWH